jgi:glycosyltransferase involved in cell wall biosynthesis
MAERPRVLVVIPHLGGGGAERVAALLACGLPAARYDVHLALVTEREASSLPCGVAVHALGARRVRAGTLPLLGLVRRLRPDVILSGIAHLNFLVLLLRPSFPAGTRVLVRQDCTVSDLLTQGGLPWYTRRLYRWLYPRADRVVCQSKAMAVDLAAELGMDEARLAVLANPVEVEAIREAVLQASRAEAGMDGAGLRLLAAGRLTRQKGFDLLLKATAEVRGAFPEVKLTIAGAGPEEAALRAQCRRLALEPEVEFAGRLASMTEAFAAADLFVLSSRYEGMPNVLLEAAAAGLPLVALPGSGGVVDLLRGQPGAWLAEEISASALARALGAALGAIRPGERFDHAWIEDFRAERAVAGFAELIDAVLAEARP